VASSHGEKNVQDEVYVQEEVQPVVEVNLDELD